MVLSVPAGQPVQKFLDGIERRHLLRVDIHRDVRLRTALISQTFAEGMDDDAVQSFLRQRAVVGILVTLRLELHLPAQHIAAQQIIVRQKLLDDEHAFNLSILGQPSSH